MASWTSALQASDQKKTKLSLLGASFPCFGLWTMHTWIMWLNTHRPLSVEGISSWYTIYLVQSLFLVVVVVIFLTADRPPHYRVGISDIIYTVIGCVSTVIYAIGSLSAELPPWVGIVAIAGGGICLAWSYLRWGVFYSGLDLKNALGSIFVACILGALAKSLLSVIPELPGFVFALSLPLLSLVFLYFSFRVQQPIKSEHIEYTATTISSLWKVVVCIAIYAFIFFFILGLPRQGSGSIPYASLIGHLIEIAVSLFVLWWVIHRHNSISFAQLWRCIMILIGAMLVLSVFEHTAGLQNIFSTSISYLVVVFLWLLLSNIAHHSNFHPFVIFGAGWVTYTLSNYFGRLLGASGLVAAELNPAVALLLLFIIMLAVTLLLEPRNPTMQRIFSDLNTSNPAPREFEFIDERCSALGEKHGLTVREVEVMQMICKGRSKAYIAETLFITENTVRGHSRRLYAKLDVHSKKALQELIDA